MSKQYELMPIEGDDDFWSIVITDEESNYHDLQILYGKVSIRPFEGDSDMGQLTFEYDIIDNPWDVDTESNEIKQLLGEILEDILHTSFESGEYRIGNESGTSNNSESD